MDCINFHIAYLLTKHKQVVIPDFGAFVVSKVQEDNLNRRGMMSPPAQYSVTFNSEIIKDDGLLVHSIATEKNISDEEAIRLVYEYVDKLVDTLRAGQDVRFQWIGKIHLTGDRKIVFTPSLNLSCNASSCGLVNLSFPTLHEESKNNTTYKRKRKLRWPTGCAAIVITVLLALGALIALEPFNCLKDMIPFPNLSAISKLLTGKPPKPAANLPPPVINIDTAESAIADSVQTQLQYFIIITSLTEEKKAQEISDYLMSKGMDEVKIIRSDGKYRVSIKSFTDKEEATSFLNLIREEHGNPLFRDVWILEDAGQM
jgi:nucleoid DNA-binding protein